MKRYIRSTESTEYLMDDIIEWANAPGKGLSKFDKNGVYLEHHSINSLYNNYIKYFNRNVREEGNGFAADWDSDDFMYILYKNGSVREINPDADGGTRAIKTDGIDSIIVDGGWGTAFAGPSITFEDYTVYDDIPDIRVEFSR